MVYEFICPKCGIKQDSKQREIGPICSDCQGQMRRLFHLGGTIFKGKGYYSTDKRGVT